MHVDIRTHHVTLPPAVLAFVVRRVSFALGRYAGRIRRVRLRLEDVNGPRGGADQHCLLEALVPPIGTLVAEVRHATIEGAVGLAAERLARRVRESVGRRRTLRRRGRATPPAPRAA